VTNPSDVEINRRKFLSELLTRSLVVLGVTALVVTIVIQALILSRLHTDIEANQRLSDQVLKVAKQTAATAKRDRECSTPGESCYEDQQSNITDLVEDVNEITLLTAVCVDELPPSAPALAVRACVVEKVARRSGDTK
jgi:hypothetical protein